jgi:tetratricopeptide (TPR) repeat protein
MRFGRQGFILLFGTRPIFSHDGAMARGIETVCPNCNRQSRIIGKKYRQWFTLFFIPIFPVSSATTFSQCTNCGAQFPVPLGELATRVATADKQQAQRAIAMYNSLRNSPANSVTLNDLMSLYASMGEYDQAISAAGEFEQALNNSEQCMTTLGRVYLAQSNYRHAIEWLDAAIARNPASGEGHYYRAVAYLAQMPADPDTAIASARAARSAGYPGAEELLRDAEQRARV